MTVSSSNPVLARIQKNAREELRVAVGDYKGHRLVSVRIYVPSNDGEHIATSKGVSFNPKLLPAVIAALMEANRYMNEAANPEGVV